ncbi:MAG: PAS domain S-box protein [Gracilimonas sp.]|uniref:sensor histidine kinase n=1 Tax=Gracilimonas sp. TaxID=1974203 RepID=UPI0019BDE8C2|nr:ATP-binding protein [Gracilimonas sp.]MBD3615990.1 PAS domain S-box protein [Gracilimonas sp.]
MTDYLKSILNAFHDLLFVFTADGIIEDYIATNHEDELILPKEAFLGKSYKEVLPPHVTKKLDEAFHKLDQGQKQYNFDYSIETKGKIQWYNAVLSKFENGDAPRYLGAVRNITDRKNHELLLRSVLNTSPGGIMVFDAVRDSEDIIIDFEITQINKSAEILTGASEKELVGQRITSAVADRAKEKILNQFKTVVLEGSPVEFQYQHINEQGEVFWYHSKVVKYRDGVVSTFMDITEQKQTENKLAEKNKELQELNRQKDKLFSVISHDLRNAVAGARGVYDMIFEDFEGLSKEEVFEYLKLVKKRTENTHELLEDLLAWSKNQFQEVTTDLENLSLSDLTDSVFNVIRSNAESKEIELENQVPDTIYVHADANMVKTILRNLIVNGIKFSQSGSKVVVQAKKTSEEVEISVIDEGVGIEEDALKKILNKKSTYTTPGTEGEKGSGLGLDLCIDFAEMHGGTIWVNSEPDNGSVFTFTLPKNKESQ